MTHSPPRRTMLAASSIALFAALASGGVLAQAFPAKPIIDPAGIIHEAA